MELNEAISILVVGFMAIIGLWLAGLTYLVLKKHGQKEVKEDAENIKAETKEEIQLEPVE